MSNTFGEVTAKYYIEKSNILSVIEFIPEYLKLVNHETRKATILDIVNALKKDSLVGAEINSHILYNLPGFGLHFVLIYDFDDVSFTLHDPGLPPLKSRRVTLEEFERCFNYSGANCGITIFSK